MKGKLSSIFLSLLLIVTLTWFMFPAFRASRITVDGDPSDWIGVAPTEPNTWTVSEGEFIWADELGDDTGAGSWEYPTMFTGDEADLLELRMTWDADYLYLLFKIADILPDQWNRTAISLAIDQDRVTGSGQEWFTEYSDMKVVDEAHWEYAFSLITWNGKPCVWDKTWTIVADQMIPTATSLLVANSSVTNYFEVGIPTAVIGNPEGKTWSFACIVGIQHMHAQWGGNFFAEIFANATANNPGGGDDTWEDPDAFDAAFYSSKAEQEAEFSDFVPEGGIAEVAFVSAYVDIDMDLQPPAEHDVAVSRIHAPNEMLPGASTIINATIFNAGLNNESNVEVQFISNDNILDSTIIPHFESMSHKTISFPWTAPETPGTYNLTIYVVPLSEENVTDNNCASKTVMVGYFSTDWVKNAIFYQISPDRFRDGDPNNNPIGDGASGDILYKAWHYQPYNLYAKSKSWGEEPEDGPYWGSDWFGGDLQGVTEKASYLADLGITAIYFNPIMDSTVNHGYHVIDYKSVNRYFGTHRRGPNNELILDYNASLQVFKNMMAALDEYDIKVVLDGVFNHASAKNQWFDRDNDFPTDGAFENQSSPWYDWFYFYDWPNDYDCWWGVRDIPNVQETEGFKDYIYRANDSVIKFWHDLGVDGWRLDCGPDVSDEFWREFRTYYKGINPEGFILGEAWGDSSHWLQGDQWDSTMNYPFRWAVLDWARGGSVLTFDGNLNNIRSWYSEEAFYTLFNLLGSHDIARALSELGENKTRMKLAVIFQMTYPGAPVIYYGDEVAMTGADARAEEQRRCFPWSDLGFSPDLDMFNHYKELIAIRKSFPVLSVGTLETRLVDDAKKVYVLARRYDSSVAILIYNNGDAAQTVTVDVSDLMADGSILNDVLNNENFTVSGGHVTVETEGMWANILLSAPVHDVAVTSVTPSNTVVGVGHPVDVNVTIENQGGCTETFSVTAFYDNSVIGSQMVSNLAPGAATTLTFKWNTASVSPGNYPLKAVASVVPNETDTTDNVHVNGIVGIIHAQFTFATLYSVNLYVNGTFVEGSYLKAKFYSYSGDYQAESTVWNGTTPTYVFISKNVSHPLGLPVEIAALVLTYENGTAISTITNFVMRRPQLMARLAQLDLLWITEPGTVIFLEVVAIDLQWPCASP